MRRAERLFEIIQIMRRARQPISAQAIADELEASKRSIYRDIAALMAQRVPIRGEPGVGYVLEQGFDMPPLMLTTDEVDAAMLGAMWVATHGEPELVKAARNLVAKIEATVPDRLRAHILEPSMSVAPASRTGPESTNSATLRAAIRSGHKIRVTYRDNKDVETERIVWPILLGYRDTGRILAAWCEMRQGFRYFRTGRMAAMTVLDERYPERRATLERRWRAAMDKERLTYAVDSRPASGPAP